MSAPKLVESIPTVTAPLPVQDADARMPRAWMLAASVAGAVALGTLVVGLAVVS